MLKPHIVKKIRTLYNKYTQQELADRFGLGINTIGRIITNHPGSTYYDPDYVAPNKMLGPSNPASRISKVARDAIKRRLRYKIRGTISELALQYDVSRAAIYKILKELEQRDCGT